MNPKEESITCPACNRLPEIGLAALEVIGGSQDPFNSPWGELRKCRECAAYFLYTLDHDNAQGYGSDELSITRITTERARKLAEEATVVAQRLLAHFAAEADDHSGRADDRARAVHRAYCQRAADGYRGELRRLADELAQLQAASKAGA